VKRYVIVLAVMALAVGLLAAPASAGKGGGNIFKDSTSTVDGSYTWDADMINVDAPGVTQTGQGVYVAVLDTGLAPNWTDYFPKERIAAELGRSFYQNVSFKAQKDNCGLGIEVGPLKESSNFIGSRGATHGTHVTSTIIGFNYRSNYDLYSGYLLPSIQVRGIAPEATIIPVKVLADYQVPALPKCDDEQGPRGAEPVVFGTDEMVAAGINYVTDLKTGPLAGSPVVINMSLGGPELSDIEKEAIDEAIAAGVVVVASAGNEGEEGMGFPGGYAPVISVGASGWTNEWLFPSGTDAGDPSYRMWWLQDNDLLAGSGDVADPTSILDVYVADFSSRELAGQTPDQVLDVLAPGTWVRGPYPGWNNYEHLPWWSSGIADLLNPNLSSFIYAGGTSMASPHVAAAAALLLEKNPMLTQTEINYVLSSTALTVPANGSRSVFDLYDADGNPAPGFYTKSWDSSCEVEEGEPTVPCDAVGAGLIQVDAALEAVTTP
jgi:subtilisin family serine protease